MSGTSMEQVYEQVYDIFQAIVHRSFDYAFNSIDATVVAIIRGWWLAEAADLAAGEAVKRPVVSSRFVFTAGLLFVITLAFVVVKHLFKLVLGCAGWSSKK